MEMNDDCVMIAQVLFKDGRLDFYMIGDTEGQPPLEFAKKNGRQFGYDDELVRVIWKTLTTLSKRSVLTNHRVFCQSFENESFFHISGRDRRNLPTREQSCPTANFQD